MKLSKSILNSLDPAIKPLIIWLNKHKHKTLSSCSGHPKRTLSQFSQADQEKILNSHHQLNNPQSWILAKQNGYIIFKNKAHTKTIFNKIKPTSKRLSLNNYEIELNTSRLSQKQINTLLQKIASTAFQKRK